MAESSDDNPGFLKQYGPALVVASIVGGAVAGLAVFLSKGKKEAPRPQETIVRLAPLPPLPPPPPPPPKPKEPEPKPDEQPKPADEKMIAQEPVAKEEPKPAEPPPAPAADAVTTSIKGDGPNDSGLGYSATGSKGLGVIGGTGTGGSGTGGPGGSGSRWGWYAGKVQTQVRTALLANKKTRAAAMRVTVRIWADASGKVTRAKLDGGTGDAELDAAIRDEVLPGLTLSEPPPEDMPMPIVMRITAKRP